jgi:hypothetical protein
VNTFWVCHKASKRQHSSEALTATPARHTVEFMILPNRSNADTVDRARAGSSSAWRSDRRMHLEHLYLMHSVVPDTNCQYNMLVKLYIYKIVRLNWKISCRLEIALSHSHSTMHPRRINHTRCSRVGRHVHGACVGGTSSQRTCTGGKAGLGGRPVPSFASCGVVNIPVTDT